MQEYRPVRQDSFADSRGGFGRHVKIVAAGPRRMLPGMAEEQAQAGQAGADDQQQDAGGWNWLDTAGVLAAAALAVIVIDIWSDGKISRRLWRRVPASSVQEPEGESGDD